MEGNFFVNLGLADMEKVHSAVIGWMFSEDCEAFDNKAKSNLLCNLFGIDKKIFKDIRVEVETHNIDILIITTDNNEKKECWVIENKIKSSQHDDQLDKYVDILNGTIEYKKNKKWTNYQDKKIDKHFCYLTLIEENPIGKHANDWNNVLYSGFHDNLNNAINNGKDNIHKQILQEYANCIEQMTNSLNEFIKDPSNYSCVFNKVSKDEKDYDNISKQGKYALYIAKNGLETIFQKCFLRKWINDLKLGKEVMKTIYIEEWNSNATFGVIPNKEWETIDEALKLQVEFQNGTYKVVLISNKKENYHKPNENDIEKIKKYKSAFENNAGDWSINMSKNKPRISLTKQISDKKDKKWYSDFKQFEKGYNEAVEKAKEIHKALCNTPTNT